MNAIDRILATDDERMKVTHANPNPVTGEGYFGDRVKVVIDDYPIRVQYLPRQMLSIPFIKKLIEVKSIDTYIYNILGESATEEAREAVIQQFIRYRNRYDFPFFASTFLYIKQKGGGNDVLLRPTRAQRKILQFMLDLYNNKKPIRILLLKARQLGGSTLIQLFFAWIQLTQDYGINSLIIAHQSIASDEILDMYNKAITQIPSWVLHKLGEQYKMSESTFENVGHTGAIKRVPQRNCKIKVGTAERPDSCRGGDYNLVHLSEVGLWKTTEGKSAEDIVQSALSGIVYKHKTAIVYESTAKGVGNFFHREFLSAHKGDSQFIDIVVVWYEIDLYIVPFASQVERRAFAQKLYDNRNITEAASEREESGKYLYWLYESGATLEAINWYINERKKYDSHARMASEYPSDYIEAFTFSGEIVFDRKQVEELRYTCKSPRCIGEVVGKSLDNDEALSDLHFSPDAGGKLAIWEYPEIYDDDTIITDRYLVVVDIGGRSSVADWSVILVIDRLNMIEEGKQEVVAQWYGHIDMDLLAWKAAQIAKYYCNALLVIESNTLETKDRDRYVDGDQSAFILDRIKSSYPNLYARKQSEEDIRNGVPKKYGFHTNSATKPLVISELQRCVRERLYTERDDRALNEYISYERKKNGSYGAIIGCHDDLLMTRAIGLYISNRKMDIPQIKNRKEIENQIFIHEEIGEHIEKTY